MAFIEADRMVLTGGSDESSGLFFYEGDEQRPGVEVLFQEVLEAAEASGVPPKRFVDGLLCGIALGRGNFFEGKNVDDETLYELYRRMADFLHIKDGAADQRIGISALVNTLEK